MPPIVAAGIALLNLLAASLKLSKAGQAQPSAISDAISALAALAAADPTFSKPDSVQHILEDLITALKTANIVLPPDIAVHIDPIEKIAMGSEANIENLMSGQAAIIASFHVSEQGKDVQIDDFAIRHDSTTEVAVDLGIAPAPTGS